MYADLFILVCAVPMDVHGQSHCSKCQCHYEVVAFALAALDTDPCGHISGLWAWCDCVSFSAVASYM